MALSGSWSFTVVRDDIIREAMLNVGAIGEAEVPTAQEVIDCARKLNMMVKSWMGFQDFAPGLKMWERQRGALFLTSTSGIYTLGGSNSSNWAGGFSGASPAQPFNIMSLPLGGTTTSFILTISPTTNLSVGDIIGFQGDTDIFWTTVQAIGSQVTIASGLPQNYGNGTVVYSYSITAQRPLSIVTCVLRDSFNQDIPLRTMTLQDYEALPTKAQPQYIGDPTAYYYESQFVDSSSGYQNTGGGTIYLDIGGAQDTTKHLHIVYMRPIMDLNNPGDNPEYPQQWYRALCWGLSKEICGMFDASWTQDMEDNKKEAIAFAKEADSETTNVYFQPYANDSFSP